MLLIQNQLTCFSLSIHDGMKKGDIKIRRKLDEEFYFSDWINLIILQFIQRHEKIIYKKYDFLS